MHNFTMYSQNCTSDSYNDTCVSGCCITYNGGFLDPTYVCTSSSACTSFYPAISLETSSCSTDSSGN